MMTQWMFDIVLCLLSCTIGLGGGWLLFGSYSGRWLKGVSASVSPAASTPGLRRPLDIDFDSEFPEKDESHDSHAEMAELLAQFQTLTDTVRTDVNTHSSVMEAINHDLRDVQAQEGTENVTQIISRLLEANQHLGQRLDSAETRLKEQTKLLQSERIEARTDPLTHLPNRRVFDEETKRLFQEWSRTEHPVGLLLLDIDHFKHFNDKYGHQAGDVCLQQVGGILRRTLRGVGGIVARYGGEEFGILLPATSLPDAKIAAVRVVRAINQANVYFDGQSHHLTVSVGLAELQKGDTQVEWIKRADTALYAAKSNGRNRAYLHDGSQSVPILGDVPAQAKPKQAAKVEPVAPAPPKKTVDLLAIHPRYGRPHAEADSFLANLERRLNEFTRTKEPLCVILVTVDPLAQPHKDNQQAVELTHRAIQQILAAAIRNMDLIGHIYENQYAVLLPRADATQVSAAAQRIRNAASNLLLKLGDEGLRFSVSMGLTEALGGDEGSHLIGRAEVALKYAQDQGGDMICLVANEIDWDRPRIIDGRAANSAAR